MDSSVVLLFTVVFSIGFGAFGTWVLMKKPNVKPPTGGGGGSFNGSDKISDKLK